MSGHISGLGLGQLAVGHIRLGKLAPREKPHMAEDHGDFLALLEVKIMQPVPRDLCLDGLTCVDAFQ